MSIRIIDGALQGNEDADREVDLSEMPKTIRLDTTTIEEFRRGERSYVDVIEIICPRCRNAYVARKNDLRCPFCEREGKE